MGKFFGNLKFIILTKIDLFNRIKIIIIIIDADIYTIIIEYRDILNNLWNTPRAQQNGQITEEMKVPDKMVGLGMWILLLNKFMKTNPNPY